MNRQLAAAARQQVANEKLSLARQLADALVAITEIHHAEFATATRPLAPPAPPPDEESIRKQHRRSARKSTSVFKRRARREALIASEQRATDEIAEEIARLRNEHARRQAELDEWWAALERCEPDTVLSTLIRAFEDNEAAATAVGIDGSEVSLVVLVPSESAIPDRKPTTTQAGNLSLKKLTKTETADFYKMLVCGHMLVTLREAFAEVPSLRSARIVAIRASERDAYGNRAPEVLMAGLCQRTALQGVRWADADSARIFNDCLTERVALQKGATRALQPVPLTDEPELRSLIEAIDLADLAAP